MAGSLLCWGARGWDEPVPPPAWLPPGTAGSGAGVSKGLSPPTRQEDLLRNAIRFPRTRSGAFSSEPCQLPFPWKGCSRDTGTGPGRDTAIRGGRTGIARPSTAVSEPPRVFQSSLLLGLKETWAAHGSWQVLGRFHTKGLSCQRGRQGAGTLHPLLLLEVPG